MSIGQQSKSNLMLFGAVALIVAVIGGLVFTRLGGSKTQAPPPVVQMKDLSSKTGMAKPLLTDEEIGQFTVRAAADILTFEHVTYKEDLLDARGYFTEKGWKNIQLAFQQSGMLQSVVDQEMNITSTVTSDPEITQKGVDDGVYSWTVEAPFRIAYHSGGKTVEEQMHLTMRIHRTDSLKNPEHVGITQLILAPQ